MIILIAKVGVVFCMDDFLVVAGGAGGRRCWGG